MPSILSYTFFQHALIGAVLASILCAIVGSYVVTRRLVIASGGMAHASLGGVGMGAFFGFSPFVGAVVFALGSGLSIDWLSRRREVREDSAVAMIWTLGMSLGILFAYLAPGFMTDLPAFLFGDILSISRLDLYLMGGLTLFTAAFYVLCERIIITVAYDRDFATTLGLPVRLFEVLLMLLTALTIVGCLRMVGIVMVISLLSVPQLTAGIFTRTFRGMVLASMAIGLADCLLGLALSYLLNVPSGSAIIVVSVSVFFVAKAIKAAQQRLSP
ncbi:MAG: metal ABC transporter permease [Bacteroidaceae bacterium]|nr:metal ABC transporter permease [Bacteroidaceae bacterium]